MSFASAVAVTVQFVLEAAAPSLSLKMTLECQLLLVHNGLRANWTRDCCNVLSNSPAESSEFRDYNVPST